jgi:DNA topoisomerase-1
MSKSLIIVESPAKTKTLKSFLGSDYRVEASMGHVRDLPKNSLGVDIKQGFKPRYVSIPERKEVLAHLKEAVRQAREVYLATDPDREGEAIAWHLEQVLKLQNPKRITFNEITKNAVTQALQQPRSIDERLVNAQQARRILDRLVGYKLSPLLWDKVKKNLSAGRVQSVAVRLIVDREREIEAFVPEEYWSLTARLTKLAEDRAFSAKLVEKDGRKIELHNEEEAQQVLSDLEGASWVVADVKVKEQKRNPTAPFITSTLQQEASRKLGFSNKRTMVVAQELYEGVNLGDEGSVGLITYMRTDSTRIADEAIAQAREFIEKEYGREFLPSAPRQYKNKKSAQDAHEAIRPTSVFRRPEDIEQFLTKDQFRLYKLIWQRFVASQMESAILDVTTVNIGAKNYTFRASGSVLKFPGFMVLYTEGRDNGESSDDGEEQTLPQLSKDEPLRLVELLPKQHFTEPPPRYTEATLVKALEERGIGRPSTYASIISTIQERNYVYLEDKKFRPTELGKTVTDLLVKHFPDIMDVEFTAGVETKLDEIEEGNLDWVGVIGEFWTHFESELAEAVSKMEKVKKAPLETSEVCPNCGRQLVIRDSKFGQFLGCSGYPECKTVVSKGLGEPCPVPGCGGTIVEEKPGGTRYRCSNYPNCLYVSRANGVGNNGSDTEPEPLDQLCPKCGKPLVRRSGKFGDFFGCSGYPKCRTVISIPKENNEGAVAKSIPCPREGCTGMIVQKFSRRGAFYGCDRYPECDYVLPGKPLDRNCPLCGSILVQKEWRGIPQGIKCVNENCGYTEPCPKEETAESAVS